MNSWLALNLLCSWDWLWLPDPLAFTFFLFFLIAKRRLKKQSKANTDGSHGSNCAFRCPAHWILSSTFKESILLQLDVSSRHADGSLSQTHASYIAVACRLWTGQARPFVEFKHKTASFSSHHFLLMCSVCLLPLTLLPTTDSSLQIFLIVQTFSFLLCPTELNQSCLCDHKFLTVH